MQDINKRLDRIEERLFAIEQVLGIRPKPAPVSVPVSAPKPVPKPVPAKVAAPAVARQPDRQPEPVQATNVLAWCAGITFLLAISYFLKLVYDAGWLTPERQLGLAYVAAMVLVVIGLLLEREDHDYAAYLPAVALVVLYLATYTGNFYYHLLSPQLATTLVCATTVLGIWLGRKFDNSIYLIFSAVGVYLTPFLIHSAHPDLINLVIYYSAWSLLFSFCAIQEERRLTYLLPMYLAILGFDFLWRMSGKGDWAIAASYQLVQFLVFSLTTVIFSIRHRQPMQPVHTLAHGVALFLFYGIEYALLKENIPDFVNSIAILSAVAVYLVYALARAFYRGEETLQEGATLVSYYCSWVAVHAIYFGVIPQEWLPWAAMTAPVAFVFVLSRLGDNSKAMFPVAASAIGIFALGYMSLLEHTIAKMPLATPMPTLALFGYVAMLYGMYYHFSRPENRRSEAIVVLYAGHLALLSCLYSVIDHHIYLSAIWGCYAIALLVLAIRTGETEVGQSALLIFCAAGLKVLLFDLSGANSMLRILTLLALSVTLYLGGWLYQSLVRGVREEIKA